MLERGPRTPDPFTQRQRHLSALAVTLGVALLGRFVYLQTARSEHFRDVAVKLRTVTGVATTRRGEIIGSSGEPLAQTKDGYELLFDRVTFRTAFGSVAEVAARRAAAVVGSLLGMSPNEVMRRMRTRVEDPVQERRLVIKQDLTPEEASAVRYALTHRIGQARTETHPLTGFAVVMESRRVYRVGTGSVAVLGRVAQGPRGLLRGLGGIEDWADSVLAGSVGWYQRVSAVPALPGGQPTGIQADAVPGMDVHTTLDAEVQNIVAEELQTCMREHTPLGATAIVLDPWNGEVRAMVSLPSVAASDPNAQQLLAQNPELLRNRALMLYEPGSVIKPITVALALTHRVVTPNESVPCQQGFVPGKRPVRCEAHRSAQPAPGTNVPRMIVAKSCNVAAAKLALRMGPRRVQAGLERFGLLEETGIELLGETAGRSLTDPNRGRCGRDDLARVGFGQGVTVSPLGLAAAFAAIVNGGVLHKPHLLRSYGYPGQPPAKEYAREGGVRVLSPDVAREVRGYLGAVVEVGTGKAAQLPGYTTGGKTGTAQKVKGGRYSGYIASFIGAVPLSRPRAVIAVVVDEPHNGYHGSQAAAPTWARIARRLMVLWHVPPDRSARGEGHTGPRQGQSTAPPGD